MSPDLTRVPNRFAHSPVRPKAWGGEGAARAEGARVIGPQPHFDVRTLVQGGSEFCAISPTFVGRCSKIAQLVRDLSLASKLDAEKPGLVFAQST